MFKTCKTSLMHLLNSCTVISKISNIYIHTSMYVVMDRIGSDCDEIGMRSDCDDGGSMFYIHLQIISTYKL